MGCCPFKNVKERAWRVTGAYRVGFGIVLVLGTTGRTEHALSPLDPGNRHQYCTLLHKVPTSLALSSFRYSPP